MVVENGLQGIMESPQDSSFGRTFKPSSALRNKWWFMTVAFAVGTWTLAIFAMYGIAWIIGFFDGLASAERLALLAWIPTISQWIWIFHIAWLVPALIGVVVYFRSIEYSVLSESGEASAEVYVRKGVVNVTRKHVPFRTITNISSRQGVIDRLFGIGNVEIQTAGYSGGLQGGSQPEEKMEGIKFYEELSQFVLRELRRFRDPYTLGTEVIAPRDDAVPRRDDSLDDEILLALRDIREILRTKL
ncbi:MAG: PH domain-containing protein [Candidatus Thorarchaeota archaeon]